MWKWFGGCLLLLAVLVAAAMMFGYRMMRESLSPDGSASVMIGATPSRVFASMAHGDSVSKWMSQGNTEVRARQGLLVPGDVLRFELRSRIPGPRQAMSWRVKELVQDRLIVLELLTNRSQPIAATRRDSIAAVGDSTRVVSRIEALTVAPMRDPGDRAAEKARNAPGGMAPDFLLSMFRMESKLYLMLLKDHIEGTLPRGRRR